ncbi:MAG: hypothetical protein WDM77_21950 [Steroidobacteraceae bacterium]
MPKPPTEAAPPIASEVPAPPADTAAAKPPLPPPPPMLCAKMPLELSPFGPPVKCQPPVVMSPELVTWTREGIAGLRAAAADGK